MWPHELPPWVDHQARLDELAGLYAEAPNSSAREWIAARDPITARIAENRREIAAAPDPSAIRTSWPAPAGCLLKQWPGLGLQRQQAILKAVLDHAVIAPGVPGARRVDINRVQHPHWRV